MKGIFFQCRNIFRRAFPYKKFFPSKSVCIIFFSEITHNPSPLKSQMVGPLQKMNCLNMALKTMSFSIFKKSIIIHKQKTKETTALFTNMRTLKFKSRRHNCVFRCRQSKLRSQATNLETQKHTKRIEIHQSQIITVKVKFCFLRGPLR